MRRASVLLVGLSACFSNPSAPVVVTGTYTLVTVNGNQLPYVFSNGVGIASEVLILNADGSFSDVATHSDGSVNTDIGVYSNYSGTINFGDTTQNALYQGILDGNVLTTKVGNFVEVWQKK